MNNRAVVKIFLSDKYERFWRYVLAVYYDRLGIEFTKILEYAEKLALLARLFDFFLAEQKLTKEHTSLEEYIGKLLEYISKKYSKMEIIDKYLNLLNNISDKQYDALFRIYSFAISRYVMKKEIADLKDQLERLKPILES